MPKVGHVQIDGRDYKLLDEKRLREYTPNPMRASGNTGGSYGDLIDTDVDQFTGYEAGLGKRESTGGGFDYATLETRFPNMVVLPSQLQFCGVGSQTDRKRGQNPESYDTLLTVAEGDRIAQMIRPDSTGDCHFVFVYLDIPAGNEVGISIQTNSSGVPSGTRLTDGIEATVVGDGDGPKWYYADVSQDAPAEAFDLLISQYTYNEDELHTAPYTAPTLTSSTDYWVVARAVVGSFVAPTDGYTFSASVTATYDGGTAAWSAGTTFRMAVAPDGTAFSGIPSDSPGKFIRLFNNIIHVISANKVYSYDSSTTSFTEEATLNGTAYSVEIWGDYMYIALDTDGMDIVSTSYTVTNDAADTGKLLKRWGWYLYRANGNRLFYTPDANTNPSWLEIGYAAAAGPYTIGPAGWEITGLAGLNDTDILVATNEALYILGAADLVTGLRRWSNTNDLFGVGMISHQGEVFIPAKESIMQVDDTLTVLPMGPDRDEGLDELYQGSIAVMYSTNNWLFAAVHNTTATQTQGGTLYAYNDRGWHYVASVPKYFKIRDIVYNPGDEKFYILTGCHVMCMGMPDSAIVPPRQAAAKFQQYGYLDYVPLFGSLRKMDKDYNSVYIEGDNLSASSYITVKWRLSESDSWSTLGSVTADQTTLYWSDMDTRPLGKKIYLRIELHTTDSSTTPVLRAVALEYQQMVRDRWRWELPIIISGSDWDLQVMPDGTRNPYTTEAMWLHLVSLRDSKQPFRFIDIDDQVYYAKVLSVSRNPRDAGEYQDAIGQRLVEYVVQVTLDQVLVSG